MLTQRFCGVMDSCTSLKENFTSGTTMATKKYKMATRVTSARFGKGYRTAWMRFSGKTNGKIVICKTENIESL